MLMYDWNMLRYGMVMNDLVKHGKVRCCMIMNCTNGTGCQDVV